MVYKVIENTELINIEQYIGLKGKTGFGSWKLLVNQSIYGFFRYVCSMLMKRVCVCVCVFNIWTEGKQLTQM